MSAPLLEDIQRRLEASGLTLRGALNLKDDERTGEMDRTRAVVLVGNAGGGFWPIFECWRAAHPDLADPLDNWSREVIGTVGGQLGARAVSPSDRPFLPFQQWAMRAEGLKSSPLGVLMHPVYGPWHAYRGALLFEQPIAAPAAENVIHLCDLCIGKPCRKACPVSAHAGEGFAYETCLAHVRSDDGQACRQTGCLDRNACPYGAAFRYPPEMQAFLMRAFAGI